MTHVQEKRQKKVPGALPFWRSGEFKKTFALLTMVLPGAVWLLVIRYLPMFGIIIAFKKYAVTKGGFLVSLMKSKWVGLDNFEFLFTSSDTWTILRNTILYNLVWLVLGTFISVLFAILLSEISKPIVAKTYQTLMFFPYFLSWVVVGYFVFAFLSVDRGLMNRVLAQFGMQPLDWYQVTKPWPIILTIASQWKGTGYSSVLYLAAITGIDKTQYEAAMIDGATKFQQALYVTLPHLRTMITILTIMSVGRILSADFGLFYSVPRNSGPLYPVTQVIDTYVYNAMTTMNQPGMAAAAGLFQSAVGFALIMLTNIVVNKVDADSALF